MESPAPRLRFSIEALIAEAKRRARQRRLLASALLFAVVAASAALVFGSPGGWRSGGVFGRLVGRSSGSSLLAKARQAVGDPQAVVVTSQAVRALNGTRLTVLQMKGSSTGLGCWAPYPQPAELKTCPRTDYALLGVTPDTRVLDFLAETTASKVTAIATARRASARFRIFPNFILERIRCAIPRGSQPGGTLAGSCLTAAQTRGNGGRVVFTEAWRMNGVTAVSKASWVVKLKDGKVQSIRVKGQPPQLWK